MKVTAESVIKPKRPHGDGWEWRRDYRPPAMLAELGYPLEAWLHKSGLFVLSTLEVAETVAGSEQVGPCWHLSVSLLGKRCDTAAAKWVLRQFGLEDAEEDNHVPGGKVRNFWRPVADRLSGYQCPCKEEEPAMVEDKGDFTWRGTTP